MKYISNLLAISLLAFAACSGNHSGHEHSEDEEKSQHNIHGLAEEEKGSDEIILSPETAEKYGIKVTTLNRRPFSEAIKVSGSIIGAPGDVATIVAKSSGVVSLNKNVVPGKKIGQGASIGSVSSQDSAAVMPTKWLRFNIVRPRKNLTGSLLFIKKA